MRLFIHIQSFQGWQLCFGLSCWEHYIPAIELAYKCVKKANLWLDKTIDWWHVDCTVRQVKKKYSGWSFTFFCWNFHCHQWTCFEENFLHNFNITPTVFWDTSLMNLSVSKVLIVPASLPQIHLLWDLWFTAEVLHCIFHGMHWHFGISESITWMSKGP